MTLPTAKPTFVELWDRFNSMKIRRPLNTEQLRLLSQMNELYPGRAEKALTKKLKKKMGDPKVLRKYISADPKEKPAQNHIWT